MTHPIHHDSDDACEEDIRTTSGSLDADQLLSAILDRFRHFQSTSANRKRLHTHTRSGHPQVSGIISMNLNTCHLTTSDLPTRLWKKTRSILPESTAGRSHRIMANNCNHLGNNLDGDSGTIPQRVRPRAIKEVTSYTWNNAKHDPANNFFRKFPKNLKRMAEHAFGAEAENQIKRFFVWQITC